MIPSQKNNILEGHVQTVLLAIITSGVLFLAKYVFDANADRATQQATLVALKISVERMESDLKNVVLLYVRREDFLDHEVRLRAEESKSAETQARVSEIQREVFRRRQSQSN